MSELLVHVPVERTHQEQRQGGQHREVPAAENADSAEVEEEVREAERQVPADDQGRSMDAQDAHPGPREPVVERRLPWQIPGLERLAEERLARVVDGDHGRQREPEAHVKRQVQPEQREKAAGARPGELATRRRRRNARHGGPFCHGSAREPGGPPLAGTD